MHYSLIIAIPAIISIGLYYYKNRKKRTSEKVIERESIEEKTNHEQSTGRIVKQEKRLRASHNISKQCVCLLGDFTVRDRSGKDISDLFTPKLRFLLIMIILSTEENPNGISGDVIIQRLWSGKNKYAARNNRNVSLTKLRNILEKVGSVEIINQGDYWRVHFGKDVLCDYNEVMTYFEAIKENRLKDKSHLRAFLNLLHRGTLLYHTEAEWLNQHKGHFMRQLVELLTTLLKNPEITDNKLKINIADTLLRHDYTNEEAFRTQCILLHKVGQIDRMKSCYNDFCANYSNLLGVKYDEALQDIVKNTP